MTKTRAAFVREWGEIWNEMPDSALNAVIAGEHKKAFTLWAEATLKNEYDWFRLFVLMEGHGFPASLRRN